MIRVVYRASHNLPRSLSKIMMKWLLCLTLLFFCAQLAAAQSSIPSPKNQSLVEVLQAVISDQRLQGAVISARVDSLTASQTIFAFQPETLVNPASVTKIFTTAGALSLLHPEYRYKTEVYLAHKPLRVWSRGQSISRAMATPRSIPKS